jgi:hypothetical protein
MATSEEEKAAIERQSGHPNLLRGNPEWKPGVSGNPSGVNRYQQAIRKAIEAQEPPSEVARVVLAMKEDALAHKPYSANAAKVYLAAVGVKLNGQGKELDLEDAPDEVVEWLATKLGN